MRLLLMVSCLAGLAANSIAAEWQDADDSRLLFEASFEGEPLPGEFRAFEVRLDFEPDAPEQGSLLVTVDLARADMGDPDMNEVLFDPAWFDLETHGTATFSSDSIVESAPGRYLATGVLELKGIRRSLAVPFSWEQAERRASLRGELSLTRTDFDVGSGEWASGDSIGLDVRLRYDVNLLPGE